MTNKVLFLYLGKSGGGAKYSIEIAKTLVHNQDFDLIFALSKNNEFYCDFKKIVRNNKIYAINTYVDKISFIFFLIRLPIVLFGLVIYCWSNNVRVIYAPMTHLFNGIILRLMSRLNIKYVLTMHDSVTHKGDKEFILNLLLKTDVNCSTQIICLTENVKNRVSELYHISKSNIFVIPHGAFNYGKSSVRGLIKNSIIKILFFGRIIKYKGLDLLLSSLIILKKKNISTSLVLKIYGNGDIGPYKFLISEARNLGIEIDIENRWIEEVELASIFNEVDICAIPYIEASQSGVISIALAAGVPVIATPVGGIVEQLQFGGGLLSDSVTADAYSKAISKIINSPNLYLELSKSAIRASQENYGWKPIGEKIASVINRNLR